MSFSVGLLPFLNDLFLAFLAKNYYNDVKREHMHKVR